MIVPSLDYMKLQFLPSETNMIIMVETALCFRITLSFFILLVSFALAWYLPLQLYCKLQKCLYRILPLLGFMRNLDHSETYLGFFLRVQDFSHWSSGYWHWRKTPVAHRSTWKVKFKCNYHMTMCTSYYLLLPPSPSPYQIFYSQPLELSWITHQSPFINQSPAFCET